MRRFLASLALLATLALAGPASPVPAAWGAVFGFIPVTHGYASGSGTETIPCGALHLTIEAGGGGGSGGGGDTLGGDSGGGAGSGAVVKSTFALVGGNCNQTFNYSVGAGGAATGGNQDGNNGTASTVTNGTFSTSVNISAGGGAKGLSFAHSSLRGVGGTASGGNVANTNGNNGTAGPGVAPGGAAVSGTFVSSGAGGAGGITIGSAGQNPTGIVFVYS